VIFVEGPRESFGLLPRLAGQHHSEAVTDEESGRTFPALRLSSPTTPHANRSMAHVAYELAQKIEARPTITNEELFAEIGWVLVLLGSQHGLMAPERQEGLAGECFLLRTLLRVGRKNGVAPLAILERWWGHDTAKRDFAAQGIAIEVKTTGRDQRIHQVNDMRQLDPQDESEALYVYSLGLKFDPTGPLKLPAIVQNVVAQLVHDDGTPDAEARALFKSQLGQYGYQEDHEEFYNASPGFLAPHLEGRLYEESTLPRLRLTDFVGSVLPNGVRGVGYLLEITSEPLAPDVETSLLVEFLKAAAITTQSPNA
jgi:hypothetical protein